MFKASFGGQLFRYPPAGVRQSERSIARILRKVTTRWTLNQNDIPVHIGPEDVRDYLGRPKHTLESAERTAVPGGADRTRGLTGAGGGVLFVGGIAGRQGDRIDERDPHGATR